MLREAPLLDESQALRRALAAHPTLAGLRRSPGWPALDARLEALLATVRRRIPSNLPVGDPAPDRVRAVHWNIEKGLRFRGQMEAWRTRPELENPDLIFLNEVDLGLARSGNLDVAAELSALMGLHSAWAPMFLELTSGRDDDRAFAAGRADGESLLGIAILSRWPLGNVTIVPLPSPERVQFDRERMYGRHVGLIAEVLRPGAQFVAVAAHLEVHRSREQRAEQVETLLTALWQERRPVILAGDFNTHTFDRGHLLDPLRTAAALTLSGNQRLLRRLRAPEIGPEREPLFAVLRSAGFEWDPFVDREATLRLRLDRVPEAARWTRMKSKRIQSWIHRVESRAQLKLDWFTGRGWRTGSGSTVPGLDGPRGVSDHAPIRAEFVT